jgi:hypothetical protein
MAKHSGEGVKKWIGAGMVSAANLGNRFFHEGRNIIRNGLTEGESWASEMSAKVPSTIADRVRQRVADTMMDIREICREFKLIKRIDPDTIAARLYDDPEKDREQKVDILNQIETKIVSRNSFTSGILTIVEDAYYRNIPAERLIEFFETDEVIEAMVHSTISTNISAIRGPSVVDLATTSIEAALSRIKHKGDTLLQTPIEEAQDANGPILAQCEEALANFMDRYDPTKKKGSVSEFIKNILKKYPNVNVFDWLKAKTPVFISLLKGGEKRIGDDGKTYEAPRHIRGIITECYAEKGRENPEIFVGYYLPKFFAQVCHDEKGAQEMRHYILDINELQDFFYKVLPSIYTQTNGTADLRLMIHKLCMEEVKRGGLENLYIYVRDRREPVGSALLEADDIEPALISEALKDIIKKYTKSIDSYKHLLIDPDSVPDEIKKHHKEWDSHGGNNAYKDYLRILYGATGHMEEDVQEIKKELAKLFEKADRFITREARLAGIPEDLIDELVFVSPEIKESNDFAELTRIACESRERAIEYEVLLGQNPKKGEVLHAAVDMLKAISFAARRKIEYTTLLFFMDIHQQAHKVEDAACIQNKLGALGRYGIELDREGEVEDVYVIDEVVIDEATGERKIKTNIYHGPEDSIYVIEESPGFYQVIEVDHELGGGDIYGYSDNDGKKQLKKIGENALRMNTMEPSVKLHKGKFCGVPGWFIVQGETNDGEVEIVGTKSDYSILNKLTRKEVTTENIADLIRSGFIPETIEGLMSLPGKVDNYHFVFASMVQANDRFQKVQIVPVGTGENENSSDAYQAAHFVGKTAIRNNDGTKRVVKHEIKIGTMEMLYERSKHHRSSHEEYKKRVARDKVMPRIVPPELAWFRERLYRKNRNGDYKFRPPQV